MTTDIKRLREAATPDVIRAIRSAVEQYVSRWYIKADGSEATLSDLSPVKALLDQLDTALPALLDRLEAAERESERLRNEASSRSARIGAFADGIADLQRDYENARRELLDSEGIQQELRGDLRDAIADRDTLKARMERTERELSEAHEALTALDQPPTTTDRLTGGDRTLTLAERINFHNEEMLGLLNEARAERDGWFRNHEETRAQLAACQAELAEAVDRASRWQAKWERDSAEHRRNYDADIATMQMRVDQARAEASTLRAQVAGYKVELAARETQRHIDNASPAEAIERSTAEAIAAWLHRIQADVTSARDVLYAPSSPGKIAPVTTLITSNAWRPR